MKYKKFIIIPLICFFLAGCFYQFGFHKEDYHMHHINITDSKIPKDFQDFTIAYFSDVHLATQKDITRFIQIMNDLKSQSFDMLLFGGDLYTSTLFKNSEVQAALSKLHPNYGKFAVLGDEDEAHKSEVTSLLNNSGFEILTQSLRPIYYKNSSINLIGYEIDEEPLEKQSGYTIGFSHYPDFYKEVAKLENLHLAGHSNGGSFYLPLIGALYKENHAKTYNHGKYNVNQSTLYVSSGLSPKIDPGYKIFTSNEILFITLRHQ